MGYGTAKTALRILSDHAVDVLQLLKRSFAVNQLKISCLVRHLVRAAKDQDLLLDVGFEVEDKAQPIPSDNDNGPQELHGSHEENIDGRPAVTNDDEDDESNLGGFDSGSDFSDFDFAPAEDGRFFSANRGHTGSMDEL